MLLSVLTFSLCALASADSLTITADGTFSATDTADALVVPGDPFTLSFEVQTNPVIPSSDYTTVSFDVPITDFQYTVGGNPVSATPTDITFYTEPDGGGFEVDFSGAEFLFGGDQLFTGPTSSPVFTEGTLNSTSWLFLDNSNVDSGSTTRFTITPEPSFLPILLCGGLAIAAVRFKKPAGTRQ